jgi:hypothetical protein
MMRNDRPCLSCRLGMRRGRKRPASRGTMHPSPRAHAAHLRKGVGFGRRLLLAGTDLSRHGQLEIRVVIRSMVKTS